MSKKCHHCQTEVGKDQTINSYFDIMESDGQGNWVQKIICCEPCWHHKKESEKYLGKPQYYITRYQADEIKEIQQTRHDLIDIYKGISAKYNGIIDLEELHELLVLRANLKQWGVDAPINQQKKTRREELESKYSDNSREKENKNEPSKSYSPWILGGIGIIVVIMGLVWLVRRNNKKKIKE